MPRFELIDWYGSNHMVDSDDHTIIAQWFAEWVPQALSANASMPEWRLRVWPSGRDAESGEWRQYNQRHNEWMISRNQQGRMTFVRAMMEIFHIGISEGGELRDELERQEAREAAGVRPAQNRPTRSRPGDGHM